MTKGADYDAHLSRGDFSTYMTINENAILSAVVSRLFPGRIPRYLDFACGTGRMTQFLEKMADESYGVDISETMLGQARCKCSQTTFIHGDITRECLELPRVDLVTAFRFLGNAQDELRLSALRAIHATLADGGYLVVNNHKNASSIHRVLRRCAGDKTSAGLSYRKLKALLVECGFRLLRTYGIAFWLVAHRLNRPDILGSRLVRIIEPISRVPLVAPYCPDLVIVAQKAPC